MNDLPSMSIVLPAHNEAKNIEPIYESLMSVMEGEAISELEIIFVDDGSEDNTADVVERLSAKDARVKLIQLFRNFGHQNALTAGINHVSGDIIITMDCDLQHPAEIIKEMLAKYREGNDVVYTVRRNKQKGILKNIASSIFYRLFNKMTNLNINIKSSDFRLMSKKVADCLSAMKEKNRFLRGMTPWIGGRSAFIEFDVAPRLHGNPSYTLKKSFLLAIAGLMSFSTLPLNIMFFVGLFISVLSFGYGLFLVIHKIIIGTAVPGFTDIIASILFIGGLQLIALGIIGKFLVIVLDETRDRPSYIIRRTVGIKERR